MLWNSGVSLISGFWNGITSRWNQLVSWVSSAMSSLRSYFPFSPAKKGPFSGRGYVTYSGKALTSDFAASLAAGTPGIIASARRIMDGLHSELDEDAALSDLLGRLDGGSLSLRSGLPGDPLLASRWAAGQATQVGTAARTQVSVSQDQVVAAINELRTELAARIANARQVNYQPIINNPRAERASDQLALDARTAAVAGIFK